MASDKYLRCILWYFVEEDPEALIRKIKPILDDPVTLYWNFVQDDPKQRAINLFERLFELYAGSMSDRYYAAMWTVMHIGPLLGDYRHGWFAEHFYKTFVIAHVDCINCVMHYIATMSEMDEAVWERPDALFERLVHLHDEINESRGKPTMGVDRAREMYTRVREACEF